MSLFFIYAKLYSRPIFKGETTMKNYKFYTKENLTSNTRVDKPYDFNAAIAALNSLTEGFSYKEEEILSDEEFKEVTAKIAELEPQYKEASKKTRDKYSELEAAGVWWSDIYRDPEYKKLSEISSHLWSQLRPWKDKLAKHNAITKYQTAGDQIATEEDWDDVISRSWDVEVEVEVDVYEEEDEYPSGWDSRNDSITWTTTPARYGRIRRWTVEVEATEEMVADFLNKNVDEVTVKDLMDLDEEGFKEYLVGTGDVVERAQEAAEKAVEDGDYDYDDVDWEDDSWY